MVVLDVSAVVVVLVIMMVMVMVKVNKEKKKQKSMMMIIIMLVMMIILMLVMMMVLKETAHDAEDGSTDEAADLCRRCTRGGTPRRPGRGTTGGPRTG
jgi:Na+/melibiose symporter-like transporter